MATDLLGRSSDSPPIAELARGVSSPTDKVQDPRPANDTSNDKGSSEAAQRAFEAIQELESTAGQQLEEARRQTEAANDFYRSNLRGAKKEGATETGQTNFLERISDGMQGLFRASQTENAFWVSISSISETAQSQISRAFGLSGCCEALSQSAAELRMVATRERDVSEAARQALPSGGGGNTGGGGGGGDDGGGAGMPPMGGNAGSRGGGGTGGGGQPPPNVPDMAGGAAQMLTFTDVLLRGMRFITDQANQLNQALDIDPAQAFRGALVTVNNYRIGVRKLIHAQQGFGNMNRELEKSFMDIRSVMDASGQKSEVVRQAMLDNMQRGLVLATAQEEREATILATNKDGVDVAKKNNILLEKRASRLKSITGTALSTAKLLNMESGSTNQMFMDFNMHLGMSEIHLAEMGRHMQDISRSTGLTGPALEQAMKSTEGVMRRLQKTGSLSIDSAKRVAEFMAAAQKHGFEGAGEFMGALSNRFTLMESKMKPFLINAAVMAGGNTVQDLQSGRLMETPDGMKRMQTGITSLVRTQFAPFGAQLKELGIDVNTLDPANINDVISKMRQAGGASAEAANSLELRFRSLGMEIGEVQQASRALADKLKTPAERMGDLEGQLKNMAAAGLQNTNEYKRINKLLQEEKGKANLNAFGRLEQYSEELKRTGGRLSEETIKKLLPEMKNVFGDEKLAKDFLSNMPGKAKEAVTGFTDKAKEAGFSEADIKAKLAAKGIVGASGGDPLQELQKRIALGDTKALQAMNEISAETGVTEQSLQDPILTVQEELRKLRNSVEGYLERLVGSGGLIDTIGAFGVRILAWGGLVLTALTTLVSLFATFSGLQMGGNLLSSIMGGMGGGRGRGRRGAASPRGGGRGAAGPAGGSPGRRGAANPRGGSRGRASARGTRGGRNRTRTRGRGRGGWLPMLATAGVSYMAGSWMSGGGDEEGMGDGSATDLLTQIRDILANCCSGGGGIGGGGIPTTQVSADEGSYLSDQALNRMDSLSANLGMAQMGLFAFADVAGDSAKSATKAATKSVEDVSKAAAKSADDVAKAATRSVDDVAKAAISGADDATRAAVSGLDDTVRAASSAATTAAASGGQSAVSAAASGAASIPPPPSSGGGVSSAASGGGASTGGAVPKAPTKGFFGRLGDSIGDAWKSTKSTVGGAIDTARSSVGGAIESAKGVAGGAWQRTTGAISDAYTSAKGAVSGGIEVVQNKLKAGVDVAGDYMRLASDKAGISHVKEWFSKNIGSIFPKWLKSGGSKIGAGLGNVVRGAAKYAGPIGAVLELGFTGMDVFEAANEKGIPVEDLHKEIGRIIISNGLGFLTGSMLSGGLGALLSPIPGGTMVGGILGYMAGDYVGRLIGDAISSYIGGPALGKMIFDLGSSWGWWPSKGARQADQATTGQPDAASALEGAAADMGAAGGIGVPVEAKTADLPLEAFQIGTKEVLQSGVAQLHEGEVIIPKNVWDKIKAVGSGAFGSEADGLLGSLQNAFSLAKQSPIDTFFKPIQQGIGAFFKSQQSKDKEEGQENDSVFENISSLSKSILMAHPGARMAKNLGEIPAVEKAIKPVLDTFAPVAEKVFDDVMNYMSFRHDQPESGLKEFLGVTQKEQASRKDVSASLEGAFAGDQAREALDAEVDLSNKIRATDLRPMSSINETLSSKKMPSGEQSGFDFSPISSAIAGGMAGGIAFTPVVGVLKEILETMKGQEKSTDDVSASLEGAFSKDESKSAITDSMSLETQKLLLQSSKPAVEGGSFNEKAAESLDDRFKGLGLDVVDVQQNASRLMSAIESKDQNKNFGGISASLEGAFAKNESKTAIEDSTATETNKMSYLSTALGTAFAGPIGAMAGFAADAFSNNLSMGEALNQTVAGIGGAAKGEIGTLGLGAFAQGESKTAMEDSTNSEVNKMSYWGTTIGAAVAGPMGAMAGFVADAFANNLGIGEALNQTVSTIGGAVKQTAGMVGLGLFDKEKPVEADEQGALNTLKNFNFTEESAVERSTTKSGFVDAFKRNMFTGEDVLVGLDNKLDQAINGKNINTGEALPKALGIFDADKTEEADDVYSSGMLKSIGGAGNFDINKYNLEAIEKQMKVFGGEKNVVVEASKALDYERTASEAADANKFQEFKDASDINSSYMDYRDQMRGSVDPSYMDYRDQMENQKGEVATLGLSRFGMESAVEQEKYGSQGSGTMVLPSMDEVSSYLNGVQAIKLDQMITHLREIRDKLPGTSSTASKIVGAMGDGAVPPTRPGVKGISQAFPTGAWDLAFSDQTDSPERTRTS